MKVKELIEILNNQNPDLDVALYTDHGQSAMKVSGYGESYVEDYEEYIMEEVQEEDLTGEEHRVFIIEAV